LLTVVVALSAVAGVALAVAGVVARGGGTVVLDTTDAIAATPPSTVPPISATTVPEPVVADADADTGFADDGAGGAEAPPITGSVGDDGPTLSPLAELVGPRYSAIPPDVEPRPRPTRVQISSVDVARFPVRDVGLEPDGQFEVPDETEIGWYRYGATAGQPGATVLAAHVSWNRTVGPFARLGSVEPGDQVEVALDDGTVRRYEVVERTTYGKLELPRERIWRTTGPETLVLITCGGDFNPDIRRYLQNIVVYAVPVG